MRHPLDRARVSLNTAAKSHDLFGCLALNKKAAPRSGFHREHPSPDRAGELPS